MADLTARLLDPETFEKRLDFFMKVQLWDTKKQELAAAIRELHARLRTAKEEDDLTFNRGWNAAKAEITAALGCDWEGIYLAAKDPWALKVAELLKTAKAEGAAEAYEDIKAQAEDLRKAGGIRASLLRLLTEECASSAATIRKGLQVKEGK